MNRTKKWVRTSALVTSWLVLLVLPMLKSVQLSKRAMLTAQPNAIPGFNPVLGLVPDESQASGHNATNVDTDRNRLPLWISNYFSWHREAREKFPGDRIFKDSDAPGVLVRVCPHKCGGLHDRLGQLPWDLYFANQTKRVLFIKWHFPKDLESFLVPSGTINWSVPHDFEGLASMKSTWNIYPRFINKLHPTQEDLDGYIDQATNGSLKKKRILIYSYMGHRSEPQLGDRLRALGHEDDIHSAPIFGNIFRCFFQPSPGVQESLDRVKNELQLTEQKYSAAHCRVRHPKNFPAGLKIRKQDKKGSADRVGLPFYGWAKEHAVKVATHAVQCARTLLKSPNELIYFFSDSTELIEYMVRDLPTQPNVSTASTVERLAHNVVHETRIVARNQTTANVHLDRQRDESLEAYTNVFVDLYLAIGARCMSFGVGNFGYFPTKISGINCKVKHRLNEWGGQSNDFNTSCTPDDYKHLLR